MSAVRCLPAGGSDDLGVSGAAQLIPQVTNSRLGSAARTRPDGGALETGEKSLPFAEGAASCHVIRQIFAEAENWAHYSQNRVDDRRCCDDAEG